MPAEWLCRAAAAAGHGVLSGSLDHPGARPSRAPSGTCSGSGQAGWVRRHALGVAATLLALACLSLEAEAQRGGRGAKGGKGGGRSGDPARSEAPPAPEVKEFLPGFDEAPKAPARPTPKPPSKPAQPPPPDPMAEAAAVTAQADRQARQAEAEERLIAEHFRLCDLDANGWLSLREAESTLGLDRGEYRRIDANQDGRLDAGEFSRERRTLFARLGALPEAGPPLEEREPPPAPEAGVVPNAAAPVPAQPASRLRSEFGTMTVKPGVFLERYDLDESGGLSDAELERALQESELAYSAAQALEVLDRNDSGQLEGAELLPFAWLVSKAHPPAPPPPTVSEPVASNPAPVPAAPGSEVAPGPGRGNHFARLDPSGDGLIDESDLRALQAPARLDLRLRVVLSAMDRDGDSRLAEDEFRAALGDLPR